MISKIDKILTQLGTNNSSQIATAVLAGFKMIFLPIATATDKTASPDQKIYTIIRDIIMEGLALITYIGVTGQIQKHATSPICSLYYKHKAKMIEQGKITPAENLLKDEIEFLKNVDYKKIKEAGNDFLTQISSNRKVMSEETKTYMEKLTNIVSKINGDKAQGPKPSFGEYLTNLYKDRKPRKTSLLIVQDFKKAAQESAKVLNPMKVFQNTRISLSQLSVWALALVIIPPLCNALIVPIMKKFAPKQADAEKPASTPAQPFVPVNKEADKKVFNNFYNYFPTNTTGMRV